MKREGSLRAAFAAWTMIAVAALAAACAPTRGGPIAYDQTGFGRPDAISPAVAEAVYRVGPGDALTVSVLNVPEYSGEVTVDPLGSFEMPLIGKVPAVGKSTDEIARDLEGRLGARYLRSPKVLVTVKSSQSARVTVDGSVTSAGVYPIVGRTSLLQALALAKGLKDDANPRRVVIEVRIERVRDGSSKLAANLVVSQFVIPPGDPLAI